MRPASAQTHPSRARVGLAAAGAKLARLTRPALAACTRLAQSVPATKRCLTSSARPMPCSGTTSRDLCRTRRLCPSGQTRSGSLSPSCAAAAPRARATFGVFCLFVADERARTRVWELQHYNNWTPKTNDWQPSSVRPRARGARALFALLACASSCPDTRCAAERWRQLDRPQQPVKVILGAHGALG